MKAHEFLAHHGIRENPFGEEDAQSDHVFRRYCLTATHHPAWDKIYGDPANPSTSVVFGDKGSGKTALRLQIVEQVKLHNETNPDRRAFVIEYDDFNPFLDSFRERLHGRKRRPERALSQWRLWDHMDALLTLGITRLVKIILRDEPASSGKSPAVSDDQLKRLTRLQKRDLLLLAAFYNHSYDQPMRRRWKALRQRLKYSTWRSEWDRVLGVVVTAATAGLAAWFLNWREISRWGWYGLISVIVASWLPWLQRQISLGWKSWRVKQQIRVFDHLPNTLRQILARFERQEIAGQPIPSKDRSDDRYELLLKFQAVLETLGYHSIVVLVDRVDEPHLVNGSAERMRDLLWPMFDNKFLKHPGIGFKLLLPADVVYYLNREKKEFYERSRLDKQNLVMSLDWTGETLYDVANDRIRACTDEPEQAPCIRDLFDEAVDENELIALFARLRVPRHLFRFLYRLLVDHCNRYTDTKPQWTINRETLQSTLALYLRDLETFERGVGAG